MYACPGAILVLWLPPRAQQQSINEYVDENCLERVKRHRFLQPDAPVGSVVQTQDKLADYFATASFRRVKRRVSCVV